MVRMVKPADLHLSLCLSMDSSFVGSQGAPLLSRHYTGEEGQMGLVMAVGLSIPRRSREGVEVTLPEDLAVTLPSVPPQCDRLAVDCAHELRRHGVSYVSLWPGVVQTEMMKDYVTMEESSEDPQVKQVSKGRVREAGDSSSPSPTRP